MKTKDELNDLKEEIEALNRKLAELDEEELKQISGGLFEPAYGLCGMQRYSGVKCPYSGHPINQRYTEEPSSFCDNCEFK